MTHISRDKGSVLATAAIILLAAGAAHASPVTQPAGLNPGDSYRLVFVTTNTMAATSTTIADYDAFVTTEANSNAALAALGTTWLAIGSTATVDAFDHIGGTFSIPIYSLIGSEVATGSADLWDGTIGAPIKYDENGNSRSTVVWAGTMSSGLGDLSHTLGTAIPSYASSSATNSAWIFNGQIGATTSLSLYGISGTLTVPLAAPEPATLGLVGLALAMAGFARSRSRSA